MTLPRIKARINGNAMGVMTAQNKCKEKWKMMSKVKKAK